MKDKAAAYYQQAMAGRAARRQEPDPDCYVCLKPTGLRIETPRAVVPVCKDCLVRHLKGVGG